ncbi:nitrite/sulfite reductase [Arsenicicoccus sp. oral taxon 190]|uniref:nitrite/sulfite reductase n=1 Tax=Arsenicicoccus sp. oral taxon 190 TaxID=1658671 RepID=UPI001C0FF7BA|nr:nitrite/sulfite reductase [Arsenicicoccus sp. oral taxon 190]
MTSGSAVPPVLERHAVPDKCPGALRMFEASDGKIARVRLAGSPMTVAQARLLGELADELGDGHVLFTTRANVQLRGLDESEAAQFPERVEAAGLLPSRTHERTRNVVVSPLTGVDGRADVIPVARALDQAICATPELTGLAGRFLIGLDDGSGDVASLPLDLTAQVHHDRLVLALGSGRDDETYAVAPLADPAAAAAALAAVCRVWLAVRAEHGEDVWNIDDLSTAARDDLHDRVGESLQHGDHAVRRATEQPRLAGAVPDGDGRVAVLAKAPMAAVSSAGWRAACDVAEQGDGQLRVTPWHAIVIRAVPADQADALRARLAETGWATDPADPWLDVHACTGLPLCARSHADVQGRARDLVDSLGTQPWTGLPVMWSGCARQCGHPATDHHALVATDTDEFEMFLHDGSHAPQQGPSRERVSSGQAIALLTTAGSIA